MNQSVNTSSVLLLLLGTSLLGACASTPKVKVEYITPQFQSEWLEPCNTVTMEVKDEEDLATYIVKTNYELKACALKVKQIRQTLNDFKRIVPDE